MDLFVLSTHWEGLPLVILEAMAQGLPVVATAVDGVPEAVADGETGYTVPHADPAALADALGRLLDDPVRATAMGRAGRARVERMFTVAQFESNLLRLYDQVLATVTN
jgi:glycosyltransferase involved in cell wall biosynthesis